MKNIIKDISTIYTDLKPTLKSYIYRLTCDKEITNDLVQETFVKAIEKQDQFKGQSSVKTWIFSIATNLSIDWMRQRKRWPDTAQDQSKDLAQSNPEYRTQFLGISENSPAGAFDFKEHINFCFTCIGKTLVIEQQVTLILKDIYDFKVIEISKILKVPSGTIKHWLFVARKILTEIFERRCALINKEGVCYQCSELNGLFNPRQKMLENVFATQEKKKDLYELRARLVKAIDPMSSPGSDLEDALMQVLRKAIHEQ